MDTLQRILKLISSKYPSDAAFEEAAGLKPRTVNDWKRGKSTGYLKILQKLSEMFNVTIDYLITGKGYKRSVIYGQQFMPVKIMGKLDKMARDKNISLDVLFNEFGLDKDRALFSEYDLEKIADYFGVSTEYILGIHLVPDPTDSGATCDDFLIALYEEVKDLSEENKQKLLEMAQFYKQLQDKEKK